MNAGVDYLVTGDEDLKILRGDFSFEIVSPREFIQYGG
jgi:predicted nucleic acid-binding protein